MARKGLRLSEDCIEPDSGGAGVQCGWIEVMKGKNDMTVLNCSFITDKSHMASMLGALRRHLRDVLTDVDYTLMRLVETQHERVGAEDAHSLSLQCRFADYAAMESFRGSSLAKALDAFHQEMPPQVCMVFETVMQQVDL